MIGASRLLRSYAEWIGQLSGATSASLYVPALVSGLSGPFLVHDGDVPPTLELVELGTG